MRAERPRPRSIAVARILHLRTGMPLVRDIMTPSPTSINQMASLGAALALLMELDVRHLPVVNEDQEVVGMLSDRDLARLRRLPGGGDLAPGAPDLASIMSSDVISVAPDDDLGLAIERLLEHRVGALPVLDPEGRLVGMLSYVDLLRVQQRDLEEARA